MGMLLTDTPSGTEAHFSGRLTFMEEHHFRQLIESARKQEFSTLSLHLKHVEFIDSIALSMLLLLHEAAEHHHIELMLCGAQGQVARTLLRSRFHQLFRMMQ